MSRRARDADGKFLKGGRGGPGRPRGISFRTAIEREAAERGVSLPEALWSVFQGQLAKAKEGDTAAARFIVDRICDHEDAGAGTATIDFSAIVAASRQSANQGNE